MNAHTRCLMSECKLCRHIMPTGRTCKSPAMRGSAYCYFHHGPQGSPRRASRRATLDARLEIDPVTDPASVSLNADRILRALATNQISTSKAAILFQGLQTVLASMPPLEPFPSSGPPSSDEPGPAPQHSSPNGI